MSEVVFALSTCTMVDSSSGLKVRLSEGEAWWASDPFVKKNAHMFVSVPANVRGTQGAKVVSAEKIVFPQIEEATAVPGAKRSVKKS